MNRFKKLWLGIFCMISIVVCVVPSTIVMASDSEIEIEYVTPGDSLSDMFSLTAGDLDGGDAIIDWLVNKKSYIIVEDNDWKTHTWMNVPNPQSLIFGKIDGVFSAGYCGSGTDLQMATADSMFPTNNNANTAMYQYGFNIPSITYLGEFPVVEYEISSVLPSGVWGTIKSAVRFLFGGSILEPPDVDDYSTLNYVNISDYYEDYARCKWIQEYWDDTVDELEDEQALLPESVCGNKEGKGDDGKTYTAETCIFDHDLDHPSRLGYDLSKLNDCIRFNRLLKTTWGQYYSAIFTCVVYYTDGTEKNSLSLFSLRNMPYNVRTLDEDDMGDIDIDLVEDPRCDTDAIFNIVHHSDRDSTGHSVRPTIISFFGTIAKLTWFLDQLTRFSVLDSFGVEGDILWKIGIMGTLVTLFFIFLVVNMGKYAIRAIRGQMSLKEAILKCLVGIFVGLIVIIIAFQPGETYNTFKKVMNYPAELAGDMFSKNNVSATFLSDDATAEEKYDLCYWVPYFEMWSLYNTNHNISDLEAQKIDSSKANDVECKQMTNYGYNMGSKQNERWDLLLAYSFCSGAEVKKDSYRVVDHFLAPAFDIDDFEATEDNAGGECEITTTTNIYFNGDIQTRVGYNWMIVVDLLIMEIVKVFLFINALLNFAFFVIFVIFRYKEEGLMPTVKMFGWSIVMYALATFMVPVVASFTYYGNSEAIKCFFLSVVFALALIGCWNWNKKSPDWMRPMIIVALEQRKWRK